jgi:hypothetical protein
MEFLCICRLCLSENLGDDCESSVYDICEENFKYSDIIQMITNNSTEFDDYLTRNICIECQNFCREILKFREQILNSSETLQQSYNKIEAKAEEIVEYISDDEGQKNYTLIEIEKSEFGLTCDEMIIEVDENEFEENEIIKIQCSKCPEMFDTTEELDEHFKSHPAQSQTIQCSQCSQSFSSQVQLNRHMSIHSENVTQIRDFDENQCVICLALLSDRLEFDDHMRECLYCKKSFEVFGALIKHLKNHDENKVRNNLKLKLKFKIIF